jgi:hypothetical protein
MACSVTARVNEHDLTFPTDTAKEAFAKAIGWQVVRGFNDVRIDDGDKSYSIDEFSSETVEQENLSGGTHRHEAGKIVCFRSMPMSENPIFLDRQTGDKNGKQRQTYQPQNAIAPHFLAPKFSVSCVPDNGAPIGHHAPSPPWRPINFHPWITTTRSYAGIFACSFSGSPSLPPEKLTEGAGNGHGLVPGTLTWINTACRLSAPVLCRVGGSSNAHIGLRDFDDGHHFNGGARPGSKI